MFRARYATPVALAFQILTAGAISQVEPGSNLLPPATTRVRIEFRAQPGADCRFSVNQKLDFTEMTPAEALDTDAGAHRAHVTDLDPSPARVNEVYLRCSDAPDEAMRLLYRALPVVPAGEVVRRARVAGAAGDEAMAGAGDLVLAPLVLVRVPLSAPAGLPEDHYLHDTQGRRVAAADSGGQWRLNVTRPQVAAIVASAAAEALLASGLRADGCYFDNAPPRMSLASDGMRVIPDTDGDGLADFTEKLEREWTLGLERAAAEWRKRMPYAYAVTGGTVLRTAAVSEGREAFAPVWSRFLSTRSDPCVVASTPPSQIGSGYGERPIEAAPPAVIDFARASYRAMRFGLGLALTAGCAFQFDLGEAGRAARWWYDEYDFALGAAAGPAERLATGEPEPPNRLVNPGFEGPLAEQWTLHTEAAAGVLAFVERDADAAEGSWSARTTVLAAGQGVPWQVNLYQTRRALEAGRSYDLEFWAKADSARTIGLAAQKSVPDWRNYGLWDSLEISTEWRRYAVTFLANETAGDAQLQFLLGARPGRVWLDGVRLTERPPDLLARSFARGLVLVNASAEPRKVAVEGYRRFAGLQAPAVERILDDADAGFRTPSGGWERTRLDSGEWEALGPFYHQWNKGLAESTDPAATAEWTVAEAEGEYRFAAWWPAAPYRGNWTTAAVYELLRDGVVVASATVNPRSGGDGWAPLFDAVMERAGQYRLRIRNQGEGILVADAVRLVSARRYNDGAAVSAVELAPFDAILLRK